MLFLLIHINYIRNHLKCAGVRQPLRAQLRGNMAPEYEISRKLILAFSIATSGYEPHGRGIFCKLSLRIHQIPIPSHGKYYY
jgi:hypothetical protein